MVGYTVTAAQAETFDNDGATVGTDVTWSDTANVVTAADESSTGLAGVISSNSILHQTALLFSLTGTTGNHLVNGIDVNIDASGTVLGSGDLQSATLFGDYRVDGAVMNVAGYNDYLARLTRRISQAAGSAPMATPTLKPVTGAVASDLSASSRYWPARPPSEMEMGAAEPMMAWDAASMRAVRLASRSRSGALIGACPRRPFRRAGGASDRTQLS